MLNSMAIVKCLKNKNILVMIPKKVVLRRQPFFIITDHTVLLV